MPPHASAEPADATLSATQVTGTAFTPAANQGYVPGGAGLDPYAPRAGVRLPGSAGVPHAPRFRMEDPRQQGLAGAVRLLKGFAGGIDPVCADVDAWGTMSEDERIAHHTTGADMVRLAIEHNCPMPPQAP